MINHALRSDIQALHQRYASALPFKHLCIDNFLETAAAEAALDEFPVFKPEFALNEFGDVGRKAAVTRMVEIGPFYRRLHEYLDSPEFLGFMSQLTGIPDLRIDPEHYGGGTHDNLNGQELDPHVDFNYDPRLNMHRRLNLLVYLNKEWQAEWGGCIDLHSNPRDPDADRVIGFEPLFNRAVLFETNEISWHGFQIIQLPPGKEHLSRKCISIYLYTLDRPAHETVPAHGTFYVQRPLPARLVPGYRVNAADVVAMQSLIARRDGWLNQYARRERVRQAAAGAVSPADPGDPLSCDDAHGRHPDNWVGEGFQAWLTARERLSHLVIEGWVPERWADGLDIETRIDGERVDAVTVMPGHFAHVLPLNLEPESGLTLELRGSRKFVPRDEGRDDDRPLSFMLTGLRGVSERTVQIPLGARFREGRVLTVQDVALLQETLARRDRRLTFHHQQEVAPAAR